MHACKFGLILQDRFLLTRRQRERLPGRLACSFRWRDRFLSPSKNDRPRFQGGRADAARMYVLKSHKGPRTLDRTPRKHGDMARPRPGGQCLHSRLHGPLQYGTRTAL